MSDGLPWFRAYAKMVDDEKLRLLAFEDRWHFVAILCCKCMGLLDKGDERELLRRKMGVKLGLARRELDAMADRLAELHLIDPETFQPVAWEDLQARSDCSTSRVRAFRERQATKRGETVSETVPSISVSQASALDVASKSNSGESRFGDWWAAYPKHVKRKSALAIWQRMKLDAMADKLIADVLNRDANDDGWKQGYVPDPTTYLNQERWNDELRRAPAARAGPVARQQDSKTLTGMKALQGMKDGLVRGRDSRRTDEADVVGVGSDTCRRLGSDHGSDVD